MNTLIEQIHTKLGLSDEPKLQSKTTELLRLLELRSNNVPSQINEYGKIVLCIDIAASILSVEFDREQALKIAGLKKSNYINHKRLFEKLLDVNRLVGTKDICIQLGLSNFNQKADELLALYGKTVAIENDDIDMKHPQYAAMAVYQACKLMKQKVQKPKIMSFSNLRPTQWTLLEQRWEKFIAQHHDQKDENNMKIPNSSIAKDGDNQGKIDATTTPEKRPKVKEVEDYEQWKRRMLQLAESKLKSMTPEIEIESS